MRIRELRIENFRVFGEQQTFAFPDDFTVIAGINGRGKTTVLDAIALLTSHLLPLISPAPKGVRSIRPMQIHAGAEAADLAMDVNCAGIPIEDYWLSYAGEGHRVRTTRLPAALKQEVRNAYGDPNRADDAAPMVVYYTTDRAGYRLPATLPTTLPRGQAAAYSGALVNRTVNLRDFMARLRAALVTQEDERRTNPSYLGDGAVAAIGEALARFLGGFDNLRVEENPLRLVVNKDGQPFDITQLSDGERSFLALVCDLGRRLALANPLLPRPLDGAGVVLIDELELHLHPKWQRDVSENLRRTFPKVQFIATTHSPFIIQSLRPGELINLDPEEFAEYSDRSIEDIAEHVMGVELPQKSERYLQMMNAAEEYFRILRGRGLARGDVEAVERRLDELAAPFSDDPAFQALLNVEREAQLPSDDASG